jgi:hypothetical protein
MLKIIFNECGVSFVYIALILIKSKNIMIKKIIKFHHKHSINKNINEKNLIPLQQKMIKANRNYNKFSIMKNLTNLFKSKKRI